MTILCYLFFINVFGLIDIPSINAQSYETVQFVPLKVPSIAENKQQHLDTTATPDRKPLIDTKISQENAAIIRKLVEQLEHALYVQQYEQKFKSENILNEELPYLNDEYQSYQQDPYQQIYNKQSQGGGEVFTQPPLEQYRTTFYQQQKAQQQTNRPAAGNHGQSLAELIANDDIRRQRYQFNVHSKEPSIDELFDRIIRDKPYQLETPKLRNIQEYVKNRSKRDAQQYEHEIQMNRRQHQRQGHEYERPDEHHHREGGRQWPHHGPPPPQHSQHSYRHPEWNGPHHQYHDYHFNHGGDHHIHDHYPERYEHFNQEHKPLLAHKPVKLQQTPNSIEKVTDIPDKKLYDIDVRGGFSSEILHRKRRQISPEDETEKAEEIQDEINDDGDGGELNTRFGGGFLSKGRDAIKHAVGDLIGDFVGAVSHNKHHHHHHHHEDDDESPKQGIARPDIEYGGGFNPAPIGVGRPQIGRPDQQSLYPNPGVGRPQIGIELEIDDNFGGGGGFQQPYPIRPPTTGNPQHNHHGEHNQNRPIYPNVGRPETINPRPIQQYPNNQGQFGQINQPQIQNPTHIQNPNNQGQFDQIGQPQIQNPGQNYPNNQGQFGQIGQPQIQNPAQNYPSNQGQFGQIGQPQIQNPRPQNEYEQIDVDYQEENSQFSHRQRHQQRENLEISVNNEANDIPKAHHHGRHGGGSKIDISIMRGDTDPFIENYFGSEPNAEEEDFEQGRGQLHGEYNSFGTKQQPIHKNEPDLYRGRPVFD